MKKKDKETEELKQEQSDNGHKPETALEKTEQRPSKPKPELRPITAEQKWIAENYLFNLEGFDVKGGNLLARTRLNLKEVNIIASEIMHEEAVNPERNRITMPLTRVKREAKWIALLSLDGQSRDEAVGMAQAQATEAAEKAAKAVFD